jgi:hypothetical protein
MNNFNLSSSNAVAASEYREKIKRVSLTHLRIQQFLHLDDRHIPLPIIRLYYSELEREPEEQNKEALMAYMMLLRDWHVTRNQLNFIRDVTKIAVMLGKRFSDQLVVVEMALDELQVTPQDVYETIMSKAYEEAENRGVTFGQYLLDKYSDLHSSDQATRNVNSLQALFPNSSIKRRSFWSSFTVRYLLRVLKETVKTVVKLDSNNGGFFRDSVPSWSESPSSGNGFLRSAREAVEDGELRRKLMEKLLEVPAASAVEEDHHQKRVPRSPLPPRSQPPPSPPAVLESTEEDDTTTIDTSAFRDCYRKLTAIVEEEPTPISPPDPPTPPPVAPLTPPHLSPEEEQKIMKLEHNSTEIEKALSELVSGNTLVGGMDGDAFDDDDDASVDDVEDDDAGRGYKDEFDIEEEDEGEGKSDSEIML